MDSISFTFLTDEFSCLIHAKVSPAIPVLTHWHSELTRVLTFPVWERQKHYVGTRNMRQKYLATISMARPPETSRSPGRWWRPSILAHLSNASPGLSSTVSPNKVNSWREEQRARRQCPPDTRSTYNRVWPDEIFVQCTYERQDFTRKGNFRSVLSILAVRAWAAMWWTGNIGRLCFIQRYLVMCQWLTFGFKTART